MGETISSRKRILAIAAVAIIAVAWGSVLVTGGRSPQRQRYYYDLNAGQVFAGPVASSEPVIAPSGGEAVAAMVFACNDCANASDRKVALLEQYSPEYQKAEAAQRAGGPPIPEALLRDGYRIRRIEDERWTAMSSEAGAALWESAFAGACPDGRKPIACSP